MHQGLRPGSFDCVDLPMTHESFAKMNILAWTTRITDEGAGEVEVPQKADFIRVLSVNLALQTTLHSFFETPHYAIQTVPGQPYGLDTSKHTICARIKINPSKPLATYKLYAVFVESWESYNSIEAP